ncbi:FAS1 domain [Sesbania bispinosa]|nr:FAS1 domain [Sesbania bispinosa]
MSTISSSLFLLSSLLLLLPHATSTDITKLLSQYPSYSSFSNYLTQTQLATEINSRHSVTVLAVDNSGLGPISGKPMDVIKKVLSIHVILEYYDVQKLQHLGNQTITVTTLFQTTGRAKGMEGFMKITDLSTGAVTFTSASEQNGTGSNLVKAVEAQPYNISVVQISSVIMPPSLLTPSNDSSSPSPAAGPVKSPVPVASPVPVVVPVPVASPVPVAAPVPVKSPVPVVSPVPVATPVPVKSPVPVAVPVASPVPVAVAVPVASPVPVTTPVPVISPVPVLSPAGDAPASDAPASDAPTGTAVSDGPMGFVPSSDVGDTGDESNSGVNKPCVNWALALTLTFFSIYVLSRPSVRV